MGEAWMAVERQEGLAFQPLEQLAIRIHGKQTQNINTWMRLRQVPITLPTLWPQPPNFHQFQKIHPTSQEPWSIKVKRDRLNRSIIMGVWVEFRFQKGPELQNQEQIKACTVTTTAAWMWLLVTVTMELSSLPCAAKIRPGLATMQVIRKEIRRLLSMNSNNWGLQVIMVLWRGVSE